MKSAKKFDLMNSITWKNEFWSHEIRPPDPEPSQVIFALEFLEGSIVLSQFLNNSLIT